VSTGDLSIDGARLFASLEELGRVGAFADDATGLTGVRRLALSAEDGEARRRVRVWMEELGLEVSIDAIGNLYGRRRGYLDDEAPVVMGSHIDSVATGGRFDGALGVLAGLEVVRTLGEHGVATRRPLIVGVFTEEEGCRFGTDMLGSAVAVGRVGLDEAYELTDSQGLCVRDELQHIGFLGEAAPEALRPHAYLELHIEQGPTLAREGYELGVVDKVQAISWFELVIVGRAAHAGTTPLSYRADAGLAASKLNLRLREMAQGGQYGELRATMGVLRPEPNLVNVIPGRLRGSIDLRNPMDEALEAAEGALHDLVEEIERDDGVEVRLRQTARTRVVPFAVSLRERIAGAATARGLRHRCLHSGAGHDAQEWASVCQAGMIFVPGEHDGISHNPREFSTPEQCAAGGNVLLDVALDLAQEDA
jgi:N-carbamoyl-L-amino-acid hydrolase